MYKERLNKTNTQELINSEEIVIVDFFADWCGPCQMFLPVFKEVGQELENTFVSINVDDEGEYAAEMNVSGIPSIIAFKDGVEVKRTSGFMNPEQLKDFVKGL